MQKKFLLIQTHLWKILRNAADGVLETIGNLEEKVPVDSDVPTAIKYLYVKISEKSEIFI